MVVLEREDVSKPLFSWLERRVVLVLLLQVCNKILSICAVPFYFFEMYDTTCVEPTMVHAENLDRLVFSLRSLCLWLRHECESEMERFYSKS